jgi:hypothetical protein
MVDTGEYLLFVPDETPTHPVGQIDARGRIVIPMIKNHEALHASPLDQQLAFDARTE